MVRSSWRSLLPGCYGSRSVQTAAKNKYRMSSSDVGSSNGVMSPEDLSISLAGSNLYMFTIAELKVATQSFSSANFLGQGGFGPVYKGVVDDKMKPGLKAQTVAVKLLDLEGAQGHKEWLAEVIFLGQLRHPHLVKLIGYCCEEEQRLLVYEFMERGSLENHLFKSLFASLPWSTRLKIAVGAAKGLSFLHEAEKPVIYRDFKASNILLDSDYKAKLSDFGLAKDGPQGDATHVSTRVMGTHGYAAPEYIMTGHLTAKSDVYSFGVVLLELLSGRKSVDRTRPSREQNLVEWARPCLNEARKLARVMDPSIEGQYSTQGAQKVASVAYQCLSQTPKSRPHMSTVVQTLEPLVAMEDLHVKPFIYVAPAEHGGDHELEEGQDKTEAKENRSRRLHQHGLGYRHKLRSLRPRNHDHTDVARAREAGSRLYWNLPLRHKPKGEKTLEEK